MKKAQKKNYHEQLKIAFPKLKAIIMEVAVAMRLRYKVIERDILAIYSTAKRSQKISAWNVFVSKYIKKLNIGKSSMSVLNSLGSCIFRTG